MEIKNTTCCGVKEFSGLQKDPTEVVDYFCKNLFGGMSCAFILYTDPVEFEHGAELTDFIREYKLGDVTETPEILNPNSERMLKAYLYAPDLKKLKTWYDKQPKPEPFKVGDMIIGNSDGYYSITKRGWVGKVVGLKSCGGGEYIVVQGAGSNGKFDVKSIHFDLVRPF